MEIVSANPLQTDTSTTDTSTDTSTHTTDSQVTDTSTVVTDTNTEVTSTTSDRYISTNETSSFDTEEWYMMLANRDNPLPENYTFEKANVYSAGRNWDFDARCAEDMKAMLAAAKEDGVSLIICSAFRDIARQTENFNNKMDSYIKQGMSEQEAYELTATIIAIPGTSEHHTGLAADIVTPSYQNLNEGFAKTEAFKWLYANCAEFGFVLRYAEDKQEITKIIYEPWHYRYVGKEAARIMMSEGICFEEFLAKYGT